MKKFLSIALFAMFSIVMFQSCKPADDKIQKDVTAAVSAKFEGITVAVKEGVVTLSGTVVDEQAKFDIENLATQVEGVKSVVNEIVEKAPQPEVLVNPDETAKTSIAAALDSAGYKGIDVKVVEGEVTLKGEAAKADQPKILAVVNTFNPVKVTDSLTVKK